MTHVSSPTVHLNIASFLSFFLYILSAYGLRGGELFPTVPQNVWNFYPHNVEL